MTVGAYLVWLGADLLLVMGVVLIAQLRSFDADRAAGRRTLPTLFGATATRVVFSVLVVIAFGVLPVAWALTWIPTGSLAPLLSAPLAIRLGDTVSHRSGPALGQALRDGALLVVVFGILFSAGWVVA